MLALVVVVMVACSDDEGSNDASPLEGTTWTLTSADGTDAVAEATANLTLTDGQASGSGGCNSFNGSYTLDGDQLSFGPLASTQMACEEPVMAQEATVFSVLGAAESYSIDGDQLTISSPAGSLVYTAEG